MRIMIMRIIVMVTPKKKRVRDLQFPWALRENGAFWVQMWVGLVGCLLERGAMKPAPRFL